MEALYFLATPLLIISGLPQMFKLLQRKTAKDISASMFVLTSVAVILLFFRSIEVNDWSLILANGSSALITSTNTFLIFYYNYHDKNSGVSDSKTS